MRYCIYCDKPISGDVKCSFHCGHKIVDHEGLSKPALINKTEEVKSKGEDQETHFKYYG